MAQNEPLLEPEGFNSPERSVAGDTPSEKLVLEEDEVEFDFISRLAGVRHGHIPKSQ